MKNFNRSFRILTVTGLILLQCAVLFPATNAQAAGDTALAKQDLARYRKENPFFLEAGKKTEAAAGQTFCIELETNPTTGFDWHFSVLAGTRMTVRYLEKTTFRNEDRKIAGAPSVSVWKFRAEGKGENTIVFKYTRSWEPGVKAAKEKKYTVIVK